MHEHPHRTLTPLNVLLSVLLAGTIVAPAIGESSAPRPRRATVGPIPADTLSLRAFNIPSLPLAEALDVYARQAGMRVTVDSASIAGAVSSEVTGTFTAPDALRRLLAGTGVVARFSDVSSVAVGRVEVARTRPQELERVIVRERAVRGRYAAERTTSATRTDTPLRDTPQSVSIVTKELIADQAMQSMADVVRYVPGVQMGQGEGHRDAPTIRGNSSTADFFVDGVRDDVQYLRDLYNVERVEALKGSNAMVFGRGGGGGVINRVTKLAGWEPVHAISLTGGTHEHRRAALDLGDGIGAFAGRLNGMYEESGTFREATTLTRFGINPGVALRAGERTVVRLDYERFDDERTVDRGIPSFEGRPSSADIETFFGDPSLSTSRANVNAAGALVEVRASKHLSIRNRTRYADYYKFYRNVYPGALNAAGDTVTISAYDNATDRRNLFNQADLVVQGLSTGAIGHTLLVGAEIGRQETENFRRTGRFPNDSTSMKVPFASPRISVPVAFSQSATDADNRARTNVLGAYVQDQLSFGEKWQAVAGVRWERFTIDFHNDRDGANLSRDDDMISPRGGLIFKPVDAVSFYSSASVSYLPSSGDQFSSLSATTQTLEPERFTNYELGAKWDVRPDLSLAAAVYRLDRTNTAAPDPLDPAVTVQTGEQRTSGWELEASGDLTPRWQIVGGYANQRARITSRTSSAAEGATVPLVPEHSFSLWNRVQVLPRLSLGLGLLRRSDMFAAIDNTVTLPAHTRVDAAAYLTVVRDVRLQLNVENLLDETYYATSHGNNNILPGAPRQVRVGITAGR